MITTVAGVVGAALLFGLFSLLRPRDRGCPGSGGCIGCTGDGHCKAKEARP